MPGRSYRVMRIAGIPLGVQPLWLVIVGLITWSLGSDYYPARIDGISPAAAYGLGLASALLLFASIVAHEYGHALTARRRGVQIEGIDLWLLGGVAKMSGEARRPEDELRYAVAGPAVTLVVALTFTALALLLPDSVPRAVRALVGYQAYVNGAILVFNLLPAFPLDGGRITRAYLWRRSGDLQAATTSAARIGRGFGWFFAFLGTMEVFAGGPAGLWLIVIGFFILLAATAESRHAELAAAFTGVHAGELMSAPAISIPADMTLNEAAQLFAQYRFSSFPVVEDGRATGLLTLKSLEALPPSAWAATRVGEVADHDPSLFVSPADDMTELLDDESFARAGRAVVVEPTGAAAGVVSVTDVERALRAKRLRARV